MENEQGTIKVQKHICVPQKMELKNKIMSNAHNKKYSISRGVTKMYKDLRQTFWWSNIKRDITEFVDKYLTC